MLASSFDVQNYYLLAEVPGAARVNLQPAVHLLFCKKCVLQLIGFQAPQAQAQAEEGVGVKLAPKPSLGTWGCACKISSRSLALHIPTDEQTNICTPIFIYIESVKTLMKNILSNKHVCLKHKERSHLILMSKYSQFHGVIEDNRLELNKTN